MVRNHIFAIGLLAALIGLTQWAQAETRQKRSGVQYKRYMMSYKQLRALDKESRHQYLRGLSKAIVKMSRAYALANKAQEKNALLESIQSLIGQYAHARTLQGIYGGVPIYGTTKKKGVSSHMGFSCGKDQNGNIVDSNQLNWDICNPMIFGVHSGTKAPACHPTASTQWCWDNTKLGSTHSLDPVLAKNPGEEWNKQARDWNQTCNSLAANGGAIFDNIVEAVNAALGACAISLEQMKINKKRNLIDESAYNPPAAETSSVRSSTTKSTSSNNRQGTIGLIRRSGGNNDSSSGISEAYTADQVTRNQSGLGLNTGGSGQIAEEDSQDLESGGREKGEGPIGLINRFTKRKDTQVSKKEQEAIVTAHMLNFRNRAGTSGTTVLGTVENSDKIKLTGKTEEIDGTTWREAKINGEDVWLSGDFLHVVTGNEPRMTEAGYTPTDCEDCDKTMLGKVKDTFDQISRSLGARSVLPLLPNHAGKNVCGFKSDIGPRWGKIHEGIDIGTKGHAIPVTPLTTGIVIAGSTGYNFGFGGQTVVLHVEEIQKDKVMRELKDFGVFRSTDRKWRTDRLREYLAQRRPALTIRINNGREIVKRKNLFCMYSHLGQVTGTQRGSSSIKEPFEVSPGDQIGVIATSGSSMGFSTGTHLDLRCQGIDPEGNDCRTRGDHGRRWCDPKNLLPKLPPLIKKGEKEERYTC